MAYDDLKEADGETYTGMRLGGRHTWSYTNAVWRERKLTPEEWEFCFTSTKRRIRSAPLGSGAPLDAQYHWYLLAHQWVRKIDGDSYHTFMSGTKYKVAHKRPSWCQWSSEYPGNTPERERIIAVLENALARLRKDADAGGPLLVNP